MSTPIKGVVTNGVIVPPDLQEEFDDWEAGAGTIEMVERHAEEMEIEQLGSRSKRIS